LYDLAAFPFANTAVFELKRMDFRDETIDVVFWHDAPDGEIAGRGPLALRETLVGFSFWADFYS
jgi:hypothetical protein